MVLYRMEFGMSILNSEFVENFFEIVVNYYYFRLCHNKLLIFDEK